jgi:cobalt-zinc-cadmium efflux system protein
VAIVMNALFLCVELAAGIMSDSLALLSDAGHMVSDVAALVVALVAQRLRHAQPGASFTFGLRRVPVLGGLVNAMTLVAIGVLVVREAIERLFSAPSVNAPIVIGAGLAGLLVNAVSAWYLHRSGDRSVNIRGAMLHLISDAFGSAAAVLSGVVILTTGFTLADPILSLVIAALILYGSVPLLRETAGIVLQRAPLSIDVEAVRATMLRASGVNAVHDLHLWELGSGESILTAILETDRAESLEDANCLSDTVRATILQEFGIDHATLVCRHPEAPDCKPQY